MTLKDLVSSCECGNVHVCQPPPYHGVSHISFLLIGELKSQRTTVSVTNGVGVQPRGGVRLNEGAQLEKHRETGAGRGILVDVRGIDPARRWTEGVGRIIMSWVVSDGSRSWSWRREGEGSSPRRLALR